MNTQVQDQRQFEANNIAFIVWMIFFGMLFGALFLYYALYRFRGTPWPPLGFEEVSLTLPIISTLVIGLSSFTGYLFTSKFKVNNSKGKFYYYVTLFLGGVFLYVQNMLWTNMKETGLGVDSGIFSSLIHAFTWTHAGHIVLGIILLLYAKKFLGEMNYGKAECIQKVDHIINFWHFLGFVWLLMFVTLFLI